MRNAPKQLTPVFSKSLTLVKRRNVLTLQLNPGREGEWTHERQKDGLMDKWMGDCIDDGMNDEIVHLNTAINHK